MKTKAKPVRFRAVIEYEPYPARSLREEAALIREWWHHEWGLKSVRVEQVKPKRRGK